MRLNLNGHVFLLALTIASSVLSPSFAQPRPSAPAGVISEVGPSGAREGIPGSTRLLMQSDLLREKRSLESVLQGYGWRADDRSLLMFYRLNPNLSGLREIPANTRITVIAPDLEARSRALAERKLFVLETDPTKAYAQFQLHEATSLRNIGRSIPASAYPSDRIRTDHLDAMQRVESAARALESRKDELSGLELAVAADRIDYANRKSFEIQAHVFTTQRVPARHVEQMSRAAEQLAPIEKKQKLTRRVSVVVADKGGNQQLGLMVYALPGPIFDDPNLYSDDHIKNRLIRYSFSDLTSPSSSEVDGIDARVWVGPARRYDAMLAMIKQRKLTGKYSVLSASSVGADSVELRLTSPGDLVELP